MGTHRPVSEGAQTPRISDQMEPINNVVKNLTQKGNVYSNISPFLKYLH